MRHSNAKRCGIAGGGRHGPCGHSITDSITGKPMLEMETTTETGYERGVRRYAMPPLIVSLHPRQHIRWHI